MHEMAIAQSLIGILKEEMDKHGVSNLKRVRVRHGALSGVVPDALSQAFVVSVMDTPLEGAEIVLEEVPLRLKCSGCGIEFSPEEGLLVLMPCPECGEEIGHEVIEGKELYIDGMDAD
jgi:hydrogenase nickel incorporation protein HypA/HybF